MKSPGTQRLVTQRLVLRKFEIGDQAQMYANYTSDPEVTRYLTWDAHPSEEVTAQFLQYVLGKYESADTYEWAIEYEGTLIGSISVVNMSLEDEYCEVGYCIGKKWWGMGITTEALGAVLEFLFAQAGFNCVCARHDAANPASGRVMVKAGMRREGALRARKKHKDGNYHDVIYYSILKDEFIS